jgi:hypothetical protein
MILSLSIATGLLVAGALLGFVNWGIRGFRSLRRNLASALVGEIAGILRIIETSDGRLPPRKC